VLLILPTLSDGSFRKKPPAPAEKGFSRVCFSHRTIPKDGFPFSSAFSPMQIERQAGALIVQAPAKVNLFLEVLAKRPDGYHDIETLMVAVTLFDTLKFREEPGGEIRLTCNRPDLSTDSDNLVNRAAALLKQKTGCEKGARIRLTKRIPLAAGLAGGSSDAAATLAGLNRLWQLGLTQAQLIALAKKLGSDVAFFFSAPAAWCTGRGERVRPLRLGKPLWFVLAVLPTGLSTARVYGSLGVPEDPHGGERIRRAVQAGNVAEVGCRLHNRLQTVAQRMCPVIRVVSERFAQLEPAGVLMSGSGPSVYALCHNHGEAVRIARRLRSGLKEEVSVLLVRSCPKGFIV
jgi:4-diphosphocytidyl-2-C-methyl-D-erythritol kinase